MTTLDRDILRIAIPAIVANITVPLLGLVDVAIAGHIGNQFYIGAIAIGSMVFNVMYWLLNFLRMGTSGMTAQADGAGDDDRVAAVLWRSVGIAVLLGIAIIILQRSLFSISMIVMSPPDGILPLVADYFYICIWGAPAMLGLYGISGWLIGLGDTRTPMIVAVVQNVVNIIVSLVLVVGLGWKIKGIATGTLVAVWTGFLLCMLMARVRHRQHFQKKLHIDIFKKSELRRFFSVNVFIFFRTACLVGVNLFFTAYGSREGSVLLAVNALLMQLFTIFSYFMDGFAYAGETLCGHAVGSINLMENNNVGQLRSVIKRLFLWGVVMAVGFTLLYALGGTPFLRLLTDQTDVVCAARPYMPYAVMIPLAGMAAFVWDGVFIGLTATRQMFLTCAIAALSFVCILLLFSGQLANHALWMAYLSFLLVRGLMGGWLFQHRLCRRAASNCKFFG